MTTYLKLVMELLTSFEKFKLAQIYALKTITSMLCPSWLVVRIRNY